MKQPFWILNSALLALIFATLIFIFFTRVKIPARQSIEPYEISIERKTIEPLNLEAIYKNDLFNTSHEAVVAPPQQEVEKIPQPPPPIQPIVPEIIEPEFFDPLPITLTGIIYQEDGSKNRAIIMDNKNQQQVNYKVGDEIEDAQIIRILRDKVILIRSNGQQEVLYVRSQDAKLDSTSEQNSIVKEISRKMSENNYIIDPQKFVNYIDNLSQFVDTFNLSTAYRQGQSVGTKVGSLDDDSLAMQIGLMPGDIIEKVDNIQADSTSNRFKIYEKIISLKDNDTINVDLLRNNEQVTINYTLKKVEKVRPKVSAIEGKALIDKIEDDKTEESKIKILKEKYKFAPTIEELKLREKQNMFKRKMPKV